MFTHQLLQLQCARFQKNPSLHIQPNTPVGLKHDQSSQKSLSIFGRIFQNFKGGGKYISYPFIPLAHQTLRDFFHFTDSSLLLADLFWGLFFFFLHIPIGHFRKKPFLCTLNHHARICICSPSPTPLRDLDIQPTEGHHQRNLPKGDTRPPAFDPCRAVPSHLPPTKSCEKPQSSPCETLHVLPGTPQVRQSRVKHAIRYHRISSDLILIRTLSQCHGTTAYQSVHQPGHRHCRVNSKTRHLKSQ